MNSSSNIAADIEPVFYFGLNKNSQVPDGLAPVQLSNHLEYSLKRNPKDLSRHLQRIQLALTLERNSELFAALCDLFIILGSMGQPLRQRILQASKNKLAQEQTQFLHSHLQDNRLDNNLSSLPEQCLFKPAAIELIEFYQDSISESRETEDVFHIADSYIENSQFDDALHYMIQHLEQDCDNEALTVKLIELYKALKNVKGFQNSYEQFSNNLLTSQLWDKARQYFLEQQ